MPPGGCFTSGLATPGGVCVPTGNFGALRFGFVMAGAVEGSGAAGVGVVIGGLEVVIAGLE